MMKSRSLFFGILLVGIFQSCRLSNNIQLVSNPLENKFLVQNQLGNNPSDSLNVWLRTSFTLKNLFKRNYGTPHIEVAPPHSLYVSGLDILFSPTGEFKSDIVLHSDVIEISGKDSVVYYMAIKKLKITRQQLANLSPEWKARVMDSTYNEGYFIEGNVKKLLALNNNQQIVEASRDTIFAKIFDEHGKNIVTATKQAVDYTRIKK